MSSDRQLYDTLAAAGGYFQAGDRAWFRMTGADRHRYLNGQITQSVDGLAPDEARYACALDAKGGIVTDLFFREDGDTFLIDVPFTVRDAAAARLERYIIADDVMLEDCTGDRLLVHVLGRTPRHDCLPTGARIDRVNRCGISGYDVVATVGSADDVLAALAADGFHALPPVLVAALRIEHAVAFWGTEIVPGTLPHEAGITARAVSFTKGCYIGQEVVSRIQSVGSPSRRLCLLAAEDAAEPPLPGDDLFPHGQAEQKPCGKVTSAAFSFALDKPVALAYLKRGSHETGALVDASTPGANTPARPARIISPVPS